MLERTVPAALVSVMILAMFGFSLWAVVFQALPAANNDIGKMIFGCLTTLATQVVGYWIMSTVSGAHKDATIAKQGEMLAAATPPLAGS